MSENELNILNDREQADLDKSLKALGRRKGQGYDLCRTCNGLRMVNRVTRMVDETLSITREKKYKNKPHAKSRATKSPYVCSECDGKGVRFYGKTEGQSLDTEAA